MKKFFNTAAMFLAGLLALKPRSWKDAAIQAEKIEREVAEFKPQTITGANGEEVPMQAPTNCFGYLAEAALNALGFIAGVWLVYQIVLGFWIILPYLLVGVVVLYVLGVVLKPKAPEAAPAAAS